ncbi:MAG: hypothetical protein Q9214_004885, partial [Letrouitia sp. 1 TL-2023]
GNAWVTDIPGTFRTTEKGKTIDVDKLRVKDMVRRYIGSPLQTIILAAAAANVDIAITKIHDLVAEVDPSGQRTLGVLIKPDMVDK